MKRRELRSTLSTLSDQSLKTSRKLDDTYYSILEKVSVLRQTIGSLQELTGLTKELHENFQGDTKELTEDIHSQLEVFNNFEGAEETVKGLEERIKTGRERASVLTKRLEEARKRVQERSEVEKKWEERTNRTCPVAPHIPSLHTHILHRTRPYIMGHSRHHRRPHHRRHLLPTTQAFTPYKPTSKP